MKKKLGITQDRDVLAYRRKLLEIGALKIMKRGNSKKIATEYSILIPDTNTLLKSTVKKLTLRMRTTCRNDSGSVGPTTCSIDRGLGGSTTVNRMLNPLQKDSTNPLQKDSTTNTFLPTPYDQQRARAREGRGWGKDKKPLLAYLEGKSPEELQALEKRAREKLEAGGWKPEVIVRCLKNQMAVLAKEDAERDTKTGGAAGEGGVEKAGVGSSGAEG